MWKIWMFKEQQSIIVLNSLVTTDTPKPIEQQRCRPQAQNIF